MKPASASVLASFMYLKLCLVSRQISFSCHHPICTGCCGYYVGVGHLMKAWETEIHQLPLQTITLSSQRADNLWEHERMQTVLCVLVHTAFACSSHSNALQTLWTWCRLYVVTQKTLWILNWASLNICRNLIWIAFQTAILVLFCSQDYIYTHINTLYISKTSSSQKPRKTPSDLDIIIKQKWSELPEPGRSHSTSPNWYIRSRKPDAKSLWRCWAKDAG